MNIDQSFQFGKNWVMIGKSVEIVRGIELKPHFGETANSVLPVEPKIAIPLPSLCNDFVLFWMLRGPCH